MAGGLQKRWSRGSVIEHDVYATMGLEELVVNEGELRVRTKLGGEYRFRRNAVLGVRYGRRRRAVGRWFQVVIPDGGIAPIEVVVVGSDRLVETLSEFGWLLEEEDGSIDADLASSRRRLLFVTIAAVAVVIVIVERLLL